MRAIVQIVHTAIDESWSRITCILLLHFSLRITIILSFSFHSDKEEIAFIVFQSQGENDEDECDGTGRMKAELDIAVHVKYDLGQTVVAIHSPYWMVNKTSRLLQYKADDIHRKHPLDYDMPLLFSFKPRYFLKNNKVRGSLTYTYFNNW